MHRLGYDEDDPYDWEQNIDHDETDSLAKVETGQQKVYSQGDDRKSSPDHRIHIQRNASTPPKPRSIERGTQRRRTWNASSLILIRSSRKCACDQHASARETAFQR